MRHTVVGKEASHQACTCSTVRTGSLQGHCNSQANQTKPIYDHFQHNVFFKAAKTNSECFPVPRFAFGKILIHIG